MTSTFHQKMNLTRLLHNKLFDIKKLSLETGITQKEIKSLVRAHNKQLLKAGKSNRIITLK